MLLVHGEDRTRSLSIRSRAPYPLGHADIGESQNRTGVDAATTRSTTTNTNSQYVFIPRRATLRGGIEPPTSRLTVGRSNQLS
jgi:hypothetical protein